MPFSEGTYMHPTELEVKTFTYKTVNGLSIKADVRRPDDTVPRPAVMWIHGGALMVGCGGRAGVSLPGYPASATCCCARQRNVLATATAGKRDYNGQPQGVSV